MPMLSYDLFFCLFQKIIKLPRRVVPQDRPQALLGLYIEKVLVQLNLTLVNKAGCLTYRYPRNSS